MTLEAQLAFVEALRDATARKAISWVSVPDDDREISRAEVDGESVEVEFVYFEVATGGTYEIVLARVSGMRAYFHVAVGTPAFHILREMLAPQQSRDATVKSLEKATARVRGLRSDL
jgi:hypothetical protein